MPGTMSPITPGAARGRCASRCCCAGSAWTQLLAEAALADGPDWAALARQVRQGRFGARPPADWREKARQARFLQYRGFSSDHIRAATRRRSRHRTYGALSKPSYMSAADVRARVPAIFSARAATRRALELARARQRPDAAVHQRRHGAVQGRVPGQGAARLRARRLQPALRARRRQAQRPRERRLHGAPPHVLRDARQLLLRRLLQARRDPLRLGLPHRQRSGSIRRACGSPSTRTTTRRPTSG